MSPKTIVLAAIVLLSHPCIAQKFTLRAKGIAIPTVFAEIKKQLGYEVIYSPKFLEGAEPVDMYCRNADVHEVLQLCFAGLRLGYRIENQNILIFRKTLPQESLYIPLQGQVVNSDGQPLEGASITVDGQTATTGPRGLFRIRVKSKLTPVTVSFMGYSPRTMALTNTFLHVITLQSSSYTLDNVVVQAYGQTTNRLSTVSISSVKGSTVNSQSVTNVLGALEGRVPGQVIRQYNGVPGSAYSVFVRGKHSITQGTDPLIIVNGMPLANNNGSLSTIGSGSAQGVMGAAAINSIPPSTIANISVLKDASATAIYGSRGANGVILITLKQGQPGRLQWNFDLAAGVTHAVKTSPLLSTEQYKSMREEAITNDGLIPDANTAPELFAWDSTRYTNYKQKVMGRYGMMKNARVELSGGDTNTVFLVSGNYQSESAVFPGNTEFDRKSLYGQLHHQSSNRRWRIDLSGLYSWGITELPTQDYTVFQTLAPNAPPFRDVSGQLQWMYNGVSYANIDALSYNQYKAALTNQFNYLQVSYQLLPGLSLKGDFGYNRVASDERSKVPLMSQDPALSPTGSRYYTGNTYHSELVEGLIEYVRPLGPGKLEALLGVTWQQQRTAYSALNEEGFTSDLQMSTGSGTVTTTSTENHVAYRYEAVFGRLNYNLYNKYLFSVSGRRDGSSRFGPGKQFGNFWAVSSAWVFSEENAIRQLGWLSFGKLRGSIGTTGNDQIGDNQFAQVYGNTNSTRGYQGRQGVLPQTFANNQLAWEVNYNSEIALDLGFFNNKLVFSAAAYRDWTTNQLVFAALPGQAGLPGVFSNVRGANVVNKGLEFTLQTHNIVSRNFRWTSNYLLTAPSNQLKKFPGLSTSRYAGQYIEGHSLSEILAYHYTGVDPSTGLFTFKDSSKNGTLDPVNLKAGGNFDWRYYGGMEQNFQYKCFQLDLFFEYRIGNGVNPMFELYQLAPPGTTGPSQLNNGPIEWEQHWRKPGDKVPLQRLTADPSSAAYQQVSNYLSSDARVIKASFVRWKSMALRWRPPEKWLTKMGLSSGQVYLQGQNLLTWTSFPVTDPETQDPTVLPPVRSVVLGIQFTL